MTRGVHGHVDLAAFLLLVTVKAGAAAALRRRLRHPPIEDHRRGPRLQSRSQAEDLAKIMDDLFEDTGPDPALRLLVDRVPRRQIVRHHAPLRSGAYDPAHPVEDFAQRSAPAAGLLADQGRYGATRAHSSSLTSLGYDLRPDFVSSPSPARDSLHAGTSSINPSS